MNFGNVFKLISDHDINPDDVFRLVEKVKTMDMKNEGNVRSLIHDVSRLARKEISKEKEDKLVRKILNDGINDDVLNMI